MCGRLLQNTNNKVKHFQYKVSFSAGLDRETLHQNTEYLYKDDVRSGLICVNLRLGKVTRVLQSSAVPLEEAGVHSSLSGGGSCPECKAIECHRTAITAEYMNLYQS